MNFKNTKVMNFEGAIHGMRNPMNSWNKSDSYFGLINIEWSNINNIIVNYWIKSINPNLKEDSDEYFKLSNKCRQWLIKNGIMQWGKNTATAETAFIGPNDMKLAQNLIKAGPEHRKFMRQIFVTVDITAPLYIWKELDTYKIGTTANSTSTMHTIMDKEFTPDMFAIENLRGYKKEVPQFIVLNEQDEIWKIYPKNSLYEISSYGRVKRHSYTTSQGHYMKEIILKPYIDDDGYASVGLLSTEHGGTRSDKISKRVNRLVAETYIENDDPINKTQVDHIDKNRLNNSVSNLRWVTAKENSQNKKARPKGLTTYKGKLTKEQREEILFRLETEKISRRQIAKEYNVSHTTINALVNGKYDYGDSYVDEYKEFLKILDVLNSLREEYLITKNKEVWYSLITLLPESWLQTRTWTCNYEILLSICRQRNNHKLVEWNSFINWVKELPYSNELIFCNEVTFLN